MSASFCRSIAGSLHLNHDNTTLPTRQTRHRVNGAARIHLGESTSNAPVYVDADTPLVDGTLRSWWVCRRVSALTHMICDSQIGIRGYRSYRREICRQDRTQARPRFE